MLRYTKVKDHDMIRDMSNMSILNNSQSELDEYRNKRKFLLDQKQEINMIKSEISDLRSDISIIKDLLLNMNK